MSTWAWPLGGPYYYKHTLLNCHCHMHLFTGLYMSCCIASFCSRIDNNNLNKPMKIYPLPHMYVVKDLVPVSLISPFTVGNVDRHLILAKQDSAGADISICMWASGVANVHYY